VLRAAVDCSQNPLSLDAGKLLALSHSLQRSERASLEWLQELIERRVWDAGDGGSNDGGSRRRDERRQYMSPSYVAG
jgi:hypothetical protein